MDEELFSWLAEVRDDPFLFCLGAFPWGEAGTVLEKFPDGPLPWQRDLMNRIRDGLVSIESALAEANVIQEATASGHGIGKSACVSMIIIWAFTTYPDTRGVITANTEMQLKTKTWSELGRWFNLCFFTREYFVLNATSLVSKDPDRERTWRIDMVPWSEKNPEAFQGMHNKGKRLLIIFDEASAIADIIWETVEGATTDADTQIIWLAFGNPTRNSGRFRECFEGGKHADYWHNQQIDSRTVAITNKKRFEQWIKAYGEDSDFVRIRVLGMFPRLGDMEFFSATDIDAAMSLDREVFVDAFTPLALGVDVARFGKNSSVIFPRKGRDARTLERRRYDSIPTTELSNRIFDAFTDWHPDGIFIDGGGVGGGVVDQCRQKQLFVFEVLFGGKDDISGVAFDNQGEKYANKRSAMAGACRAWLKTGLLPNDGALRAAMLGIRYTINKKDEIQLISKEDLLEDNPELIFDDLDALFCTFGGPLARNAYAGGEHLPKASVEHEYNPFDAEHMAA